MKTFDINIEVSISNNFQIQAENLEQAKTLFIDVIKSSPNQVVNNGSISFDEKKIKVLEILENN